MLQSNLFTKTRKEPPADEESKNAKLLIQAGYIHKEMAGVYDFLPLGLRTRNNIEAVIRDEMDGVGGQEMNLSSLQSSSAWKQTDRWSEDKVDVWFKTEIANGTQTGLGFTHEEPLTHLLTNHISSYRDLPKKIYQFQTKFRNEVRAKAGIMRGREFLMKDLYSFSRNQEEHEEIYQEMKEAYEKIFNRIGLGDDTIYTYADGGSFSDFSHEFQTISDAGEDTIYIDEEKQIAVNDEVMDSDVLDELGLDKGDLRTARSIEVGNIFPLGTKFSTALELTFTDEDGEEKPVIMGSYGIGVGRLMGAIVEIMADEDGLVWPEHIAPYQAHLLVLGNDAAVRDAADELYQYLQSHNLEVLYDDRSVSAGEKFADADLLGMPYRLVVSPDTIAEGKVEVKKRTENKEKLISRAELLELCK